MAKLPNETLEQYVARLEAENKSLDKRANGMGRSATSVVPAIGEKKGVSIYIGKSRFPCTLYLEQFITLLEGMPTTVLPFIADNFDKFAVKDESGRDGLRRRFVELKVKSEAHDIVIDSDQIKDLTQQLADAHAMLEELTKSSAGDEDKDNSEGDGEGDGLTE